MAALNEKARVRVLIAGDCLFSVEGLRCALAAMPDIFVVDIASRADTIGKVAELAPDVVLIHFSSDWTEALGLAQDLTAATADTRVIVLGVPDGEDKILECAEAGAKGWLPVSGSVGDLGKIIQMVDAGEAPCSPGLAYRLFMRLSELAANSIPDNEPVAPNLTARETEIMALLGEEKSNEQIAAELHISVPTVKKHVHNILEKMRVRSRAQLSDRRPGVMRTGEPI